MIRIRLALALAFVAASLVPTAAQATTAATRRAISEAREVFPLPWCATVHIYPAVAQPGEIAWVFPGQQPCTVYFDQHDFRSIRDGDPEYYCALLAHEFGHLSGLGHSPDQDNIMYPTVGGYIPKPCRNAKSAK